MLKRSTVLLCDDEASIRLTIGDYLSAQGCQIEEAADLAQLRGVLRARRPDVLVLDYRLTDGYSLDIVPELKMLYPNLPIVILTGHGSIDLAVRAIQAGADQFMTKPVELEALAVMLQRLLSSRQIGRRDAASRTRSASCAVDPFIGTTEAMRRLQHDARRVAATDRPVLIEGETGSGKGVLTRWLHRAGARADEPIVELNCAAFARELIDSELFGHERGAFTGAITAKQGLFEVADRGTLFLDEIGDMELGLQAKLLKAVEEKKFRRVGDLRERVSDIRLVAATHRNLAELAHQEKFRSDLYFRISTMRLTIPSLRSRREDIPMLAGYFVHVLCGEMARSEAVVEGDALSALQQYHWPGNLRELRNVLERALLLTDGNVITKHDLRFDYETVAATATGGDSLADAERAHVERIVKDESGDIDRAAARLGIARSTLYQKLKKYNSD
jgi:DNA-binding NtrC family response regulator